MIRSLSPFNPQILNNFRVVYSPSRRQSSSIRSRKSHIPELLSLAKASLKLSRSILPQKGCHPRMTLSGNHDFRLLEVGFPIRTASGTTVGWVCGRIALLRSLNDGNKLRLRASTNISAVPIHLHPKVSAQRRAPRSSSTSRWEGLRRANEITSLSHRPRSQAATRKSRGILVSVLRHGCFARCLAGKSFFPESVTSLRTASGTDISRNRAGNKSCSPLLNRQIRGDAFTTTRSIDIGQLSQNLLSAILER